MEEHDDVSKGSSLIPRSDLKIGGDEQLDLSVNPILTSVNNGHASNGIEEVKLTSCEVDLSTDVVVCEKGALVKSNDVEGLAKERSVLDLNADAVSSCLNDELSSVCSSRRLDSNKSSLTDVYSECGSSNVSVSVMEKDPMKLWKAMKQNGFFSKPHAGISSVSSSCLVSSSHGGIPAPRKRGGGRKIKSNDAAIVKKRKIEIARKEEVDRFARLAAPSGLLNELNPAIINHVRNKKQVLSIIENVVRDSRNVCNRPIRHSSTIVGGGSEKNLEDSHEEKCVDGELSEENNTAASRFQVANKFSENDSSLSSEDTSEINCTSILTVKAATVASQWLELLHQDLKGRVSALRRSKKRVRAVVTTELPFLITKEFSADQENNPNVILDEASRDSTVDIHKARWMNLFNQLEQTLSDEEKQLESSLNQLRELQSHCDRGLQNLSFSSGQSFLQLGMPVDSRAANALISDKDLVVRASAASMYSTCHFLSSKENVTCT